nr:hypothetical protein [Mycobacterium leprae]
MDLRSICTVTDVPLGEGSDHSIKVWDEDNVNYVANSVNLLDF